MACAQPGETLNPFEGGSLERASALSISRYGQPVSWVLDRERVQGLLHKFDHEMYLFKYDILPLSDTSHMRLEVIWPSGAGIPWTGGTTLDSVEFMIDAGPGLIGQSTIGLQWEIPPGFLDGLFTALSDITPTPLPRTPYLTPTPTATVLPPRAVYFGQPAGRLAWDGPDSRVWSSDFDHCSNGQIITDFGVPGSIAVEPDLGFWAIGIMQPPPADLHWTGYSHGDWQLWQETDPGLLYLVYMREPRVAFTYRSMPCF